jgi:histone deacetylase complex regulatory component SIN3
MSSPRPPGCKDALAYLHKVKTTVAHQPEVYDEFLSIINAIG